MSANTSGVLMTTCVSPLLTVIYIDGNKIIDKFTALSGSSPAIVIRFRLKGPGGERTGPFFFAQFFCRLLYEARDFLRNDETRTAIAIWALKIFIQWLPMKDKLGSSTEEKDQNNPSTNKKSPKIGKVIVPKEPVKRYRVTVHYLPVTEEEARIKKAIIESIMKKTPPK
ncbi:hypothetical protein KHS38_14305 [Mucilaginibacter sp. Bleaf8]|uniref:hypothetical protein n=1 Tax=Mucilaginibacter sp. Bleaf8 TaxID=2834430 RepID=UPI001BCFF46E|nr:hypothetical protein [Mucilaginibacter sp. Bleaf8]MBS7565582.1 hypothetical protein [Mucilaginibacter sp. Bleaf8]